MTRIIYSGVDPGKSGAIASLDQDGVGQLVKIAIEKGRATRPDIKLGICGEHGGDPDSVKFFHRVGLNYVSCSPFRVPVARLAAAQAAIEEKRAGGHSAPAKAKKAAKAPAKVAARRGRPAKQK